MERSNEMVSRFGGKGTGGGWGPKEGSGGRGGDTDFQDFRDIRMGEEAMEEAEVPRMGIGRIRSDRTKGCLSRVEREERRGW
ncbi:hypothetical protein SLA2020_440070 [Shorea laevis]